MSSPIPLWTAVDDRELQAIASAGWRSWLPERSLERTQAREDAVAVARRVAKERGIGHVVRLEIDPALVEKDARVLQPGDIDRALTCAIIADAEYRGSATDVEIRTAEASMREPFPDAWRAHLRKPVRFCRGWMATGAYVWLYQPTESADYILAWGELASRPGMIVIGGDGAGEMITVDARDPNPPVTLTPNVSIGWKDSVVQTSSIDEFLNAVENGTFDFVFGGP